ncbi:hypothetical protein SAMN04487857_103208 [Pseudomonas sp. ok272]|uniref:hypothetical protein n=1 Tax=unclassified Pseudomonas TaxID=196821 RepID=UPI0008C855D2|nr:MULTISPECIES: hypothetical protein [unclassified Pseudomonas]SEM61395.1 hypothetical protein SAMN04487857_103208 [Pseudomonas sp. ok272]SFM48865.1 hypothetical protein SAMN04487858_103227 [Pseudomonas sp. ok602]
MTIESKNWFAQINRMPGDLFFRAEGTITVATPGVTPVLVVSPQQDKSFNLRLELELHTSEGVHLQVLTDKVATYKSLGASNVTGVDIFYKGEHVHSIKDVMITH